MVEVYRGHDFVQLQTPGTRDVIVFEEGLEGQGRARRAASRTSDSGCRIRTDVALAARAVTDAGGTVKSTGEFCPGEPYVFAADPDGYEIEIWFEIPTPVDPPADPDETADKEPALT